MDRPRGQFLSHSALARKRPVAGNSSWTSRRTGRGQAGGGQDENARPSSRSSRRSCGRTRTYAFGKHSVSGVRAGLHAPTSVAAPLLRPLPGSSIPASGNRPADRSAGATPARRPREARVTALWLPSLISTPWPSRSVATLTAEAGTPPAPHGTALALYRDDPCLVSSADRMARYKVIRHRGTARTLRGDRCERDARLRHAEGSSVPHALCGREDRTPPPPGAMAGEG
jgi:hypothetical protein